MKSRSRSLLYSTNSNWQHSCRHNAATSTSDSFTEMSKKYSPGPLDSERLKFLITLHFVWCLAHHGIYSMYRSLQFFPNGLVNHLLSLNGSLSFKLGRNHLYRNVRAIGIIIGACYTSGQRLSTTVPNYIAPSSKPRTSHFDIIRLESCLNLFFTYNDHGSIRFARAHTAGN
jgi:hypothetical protein